jgi:hypothetical protein
VTFFEPATQSFEDQTGGARDLAFLPDKTIRRMPAKVVSAPREPITSADLFALQRSFDRFINQLNSPRTRKT